MFVAVAVITIVPTMEFLSWRKALRAGQTPAPSQNKLALVRFLLHAELVGVVIILLAAAIMVRGGLV